ncbi:oligogalacturonide transport system permease protein [Loktanella sp. DSM 29012]|uniref:Carbohydrate ABC transporter permease n=2 Tax=Roseobacteraceae TaxID=2854170 RepID=A0ABS8BXZ6_9RHOB|nr:MULTISPECIES: carbohydrate ABC transporter permease [Loktanella]MCB5200444.1 carbohydrate ABC transporter permease [Loktanella gaetbuli]SEQ38825.1 oligogalacturonide transport system permease protein [Loktanella sp. DSM 29012]
MTTIPDLKPMPQSERTRSPQELKIQREQRRGAIIRYVVLTAFGLLMLYPLIWLVGASFKTNEEIFSSAAFWPKDPTIQGYIDGWQTSTPYTFARFFMNSLYIVIPKMLGTAFSSVIVAYGFARFDFPGKKILFGILIATLLLPDVVTRIPQYLLFRELGWLDTYLPLFVPQWFALEAFFVFMLIQFMRSIPRDMEEAARVDGANTFQVLWYVVVPMLMPAIISVCLFQFMWTMNDFLGPLIYISSVENYPVSLALKLSIDTTEAFNWNQILAMTVLALAPSLIVFFIAQKYFIEGISTGGVKG